MHFKDILSCLVVPGSVNWNASLSCDSSPLCYWRLLILLSVTYSWSLCYSLSLGGQPCPWGTLLVWPWETLMSAGTRRTTQSPGTRWTQHISTSFTQLTWTTASWRSKALISKDQICWNKCIKMSWSAQNHFKLPKKNIMRDAEATTAQWFIFKFSHCILFGNHVS